MFKQTQFNIILLVHLILATSGPILSQAIHIPEAVIVRNDAKEGFVTYYTVQSKNTLYSICRFYHCTLSDLNRTNPHLDLALLTPGETLKIPFYNVILEDIKSVPPTKDHIPVYYKTAKKDNLFRIARVYFDRNIKTLKRINNLNNNDIKPDQLLLIGWKKISLQISPLPPTESIVKDEPEVINDRLKDTSAMVFVKKLESDPEQQEGSDTIQTKLEEQHLIHQNGLAIWNKMSSSSGSFALHNEAKPGSFIEITNPQVNRKSHIKVIGKIPGNSYPSNVKVILSPEAARSLRALDSRFYVRMNYIVQ